MGLVRFFKFDSDGFNTEHDPSTDELSLLGAQIGANGLSSSGDIALSGGAEVTGLPATPTGNTAAGSKAYIDKVASNLRPKTACVVATTADLTSYVATGSGAGKTLEAPDSNTSHNTIDGVLLVVDDRVLVKNQGGGASHADNGIYTVTTLGDGGSAKFKLTRATDCDDDTEVTSGITTFIAEGTANQRRHYTLVTPDPVTVDTTAQEWSIFGGPGQSHDSLTDVSADDHHNQQHGLESTSDHSLTGATAGHVLRATGATTFAFGQVQHSDIGTVGENDHHDRSHGLESTSDHTASGLTAGHVLRATGATTFAFGQVQHSDIGTVGEDDHHNRQHAITSASDHSETGLTSGHVLTATGATTFAWQAPAGAANTQFTATAGTGGVTKGDPVYVSANGTVLPCNNTNNNTRKYCGVAQETKSASETVIIQQDGILTDVSISGSPAGGDLVYLATPNGLTVTVPTGTGTHRMVVGKVYDATATPDLVIEPQYLGKIG